MRFKEKNGSVVCRDLLGYDLTVPEDKVFIKEKSVQNGLPRNGKECRFNT